MEEEAREERKVRILQRREERREKRKERDKERGGCAEELHQRSMESSEAKDLTRLLVLIFLSHSLPSFS